MIKKKAASRIRLQIVYTNNGFFVIILALWILSSNFADYESELKVCH